MPPAAQIAALCGLAIVLVALAIYIVMRIHGTPEKREQKRRLKVNRLGRLGDALITEASDAAIYYSYSIRGVQYTASQDVSGLRERLPIEPEQPIDPRPPVGNRRRQFGMCNVAHPGLEDQVLDTQTAADRGLKKRVGIHRLSSCGNTRREKKDTQHERCQAEYRF